MNLLWDPKKPVDFNAEVNYACAGFSDKNDTYFEHDKDLEYFSVPCQDDGFFKTPVEWFKCLKGTSNIISLWIKKQYESFYESIISVNVFIHF